MKPSIPAAKVYAAAPLDALLKRLTEDLERLRLWTPGSSDLTVLDRMREQLARSIDEAQRMDVWVSPKLLSKMKGKPVSTVTRWCARYGEAAGWAVNKAGWNIHLPSFESWYLDAKKEAA